MLGKLYFPIIYYTDCHEMPVLIVGMIVGCKFNKHIVINDFRMAARDSPRIWLYAPVVSQIV